MTHRDVSEWWFLSQQHEQPRDPPLDPTRTLGCGAGSRLPWPTGDMLRRRLGA